MTEDLRHPLFARLYPRVDARLADAGGTANRAALLAGAAGRLLEVGAGHGANFTHYPASVTGAIALEPEPRLRALAQQAAARAPVPVEVRAGRAEALDGIADASVDVAVVSLVLCSVRDPGRALAELRRVLRPGGELRYYEHVRSTRSGTARIQRAADLLWPLLAGGCHVARPTDRRIAEAGFTVRAERHFTFPPGVRLNPAAPHVIGTAERTA